MHGKAGVWYASIISSGLATQVCQYITMMACACGSPLKRSNLSHFPVLLRAPYVVKTTPEPGGEAGCLRFPCICTGHHALGMPHRACFIATPWQVPPAFSSWADAQCTQRQALPQPSTGTSFSCIHTLQLQGVLPAHLRLKGESELAQSVRWRVYLRRLRVGVNWGAVAIVSVGAHRVWGRARFRAR